MYCDGWSHPFSRSLHVGDLIIVQGTAPEDIETGPDPEGDVIVFHQSVNDGELIVHRAIDKHISSDGKIYFITKGDGNSGPDPTPIPADNVVGRVVMRIPWLGHLSLLLRNSSGIFIILALIILLVVLEFVVPLLGKEKGIKETAEESWVDT
jgi:signal peptidase